MSPATGLMAGSLIAGGVQVYFAPVDRTNLLPAPFDPAVMGGFALGTPPAGWLSVGTALAFKRVSQTALLPVESGAPATVKSQVRTAFAEEIECTLPAWNRVGMALSSGVQTMNLLATAQGANANPSGGVARAAEALLPGSTATVLQLGAATAVLAGDIVAVDVDYAGQNGYVGSGASGTYVAAGAAIQDVHSVRRVSFNVARVLAVNGGTVTLASALPAGVPVAGMKVAVVNGFVDRSGGAFFPEWSGLFVVDGVQGDRLLLHYPRLQPVGQSAAEVMVPLAAGVERWRPAVKLRALPVTDANDGAAAVCFRSYLPAPMRLV